MKSYYSNGKILLTGEYLVLKGAKVLALPVNKGQELIISQDNKQIEWKTFELNHKIFSATFKNQTLEIIKCSNMDKARYIQNLLLSAIQRNENFATELNDISIQSKINFNMSWGLGTSSTLINNVAQWASINPFKLNNAISKGSGYDIACAYSKIPIFYQLINNEPTIHKTTFNPPFIENISLVYLNKKMATEKNIANFVDNDANFQLQVKQISTLTEKFQECTSLNEFMTMVELHEKIVSQTINQKSVQTLLFPDFNGKIKSLGAWGGDFILAVSESKFSKQKEYFNNKGYTTVIPLTDFIINS